jgi:hypothetical protein
MRYLGASPEPLISKLGYGGGTSSIGFPPAPTFGVNLINNIIPYAAGGSSTPTFTRATTATVSDWEGVLRTAISGEVRFQGARRAANLYATTSETFSNAAWTKRAGTTLTSGQSDPNGGTSAFKVTVAVSDGYIYQTPTLVAGHTYCLSCYMKAGSLTNGRLSIWTGANTIAANVTLTASWQRFAVIGTASAGAGAGDAGSLLDANSTGDYYIFGAQLEDISGASVSAPNEYVSVGVLSAPYHGANVDGVKYFTTQNGNSVASNVVTEATGAGITDSTLKGYLAEGARTNRCLWSEEFDNAVWAATNITVGAEVSAPDGATTAETLTASAGNGTIIQDLGVVASAAKTFSVWLKRKTGTGNIDLTMDGGASWTTKTITSSWARYSVTQTLADEDVGIRIVTNTDAIYAWGAQVETAAFASSYIATTAAAVTRNADVLTWAASGNVSDSVGTSYCELTLPLGVSDANARVVSSSGGEGPLLFSSSGQPRMYDGTTFASSGLGNMAVGTTYRNACKWSGSAVKNWLDGVAGSGQSFDGAFNFSTGNSVGIGQTSDSPFGTIKNVRIWISALSDQQIAGLV